MIDIVLFALPVDRHRAETILDGLYEAGIAGTYRTRFVTEHPLDAGWMEAIRSAGTCPCVIFCWSKATAKADAAPLRTFAVQAFAQGHAISVLLDPEMLPSEMAGSTTYPLFGWRSHKNAWVRFFFGDSYTRQIAAAASRKASGQDPPPPQAFWSMVRAHIWALILGVVAVLGAGSMLWNLYNDEHIAKVADRASGRAFEAARQKRSCRDLRAFIGSHEGSPWAADAQTLIASCHMEQRRVQKDDEQFLPAFGESLPEAQADAKRVCERYARSIHGQVKRTEVLEFMAGERATAHCLTTYDELEPVEIMEK